MGAANILLSIIIIVINRNRLFSYVPSSISSLSFPRYLVVVSWGHFHFSIFVIKYITNHTINMQEVLVGPLSSARTLGFQGKVERAPH